MCPWQNLENTKVCVAQLALSLTHLRFHSKLQTRYNVTSRFVQVRNAVFKTTHEHQANFITLVSVFGHIYSGEFLENYQIKAKWIKKTAWVSVAVVFFYY